LITFSGLWAKGCQSRGQNNCTKGIGCKQDNFNANGKLNRRGLQGLVKISGRLISSKSLKLLQCVTIGRNVSAIRSGGPDNFRQVDVTSGIDGDVVGREKIAWSRRVCSTAPAIDQCAMSIEDANATSGGIESRSFNTWPHSRPISQFSNIEVVITIKSDLTWTSDLRHLVNESPIRREALQATILPISDPDNSLRIDGNPMRNMKLPRTVSRFTPRRDQCAIGIKPVDTSVSVTIRNIKVTAR